MGRSKKGSFSIALLQIIIIIIIIIIIYKGKKKGGKKNTDCAAWFALYEQVI